MELGEIVADKIFNIHDFVNVPIAIKKHPLGMSLYAVNMCMNLLHMPWDLQVNMCLWGCVCSPVCNSSSSQICINNHPPPAPSDTSSLWSSYPCRGIWMWLSQALHWTQTETLGGKVLTDVDRGSHYWWMGSSINASRRLQENDNEEQRDINVMACLRAKECVMVSVDRK